jgi:hypothetical protein
MAERKIEQYSADETKRRFEAALRGARIAGSQHIKNNAPKRPKRQRKVHRKKVNDRA